jgi:hypothetical protein
MRSDDLAAVVGWMIILLGTVAVLLVLPSSLFVYLVLVLLNYPTNIEYYTIIAIYSGFREA